MNGAKLAFGMVCFLLFGTLALGYSLVMTSIPVTIAKAQTEVIEARAQAHIDEMYAAENVARMAQARNEAGTRDSTLLGVVTGGGMTLLIIALFVIGKSNMNRVHSYGRMYPPGYIREIDGVKYRVIGQRGDWIEIEPISQRELAESRMK